MIGRNGLLLETLDLTLSNQGFGLSIGLLVTAVAAVVASVVVVIVDMMFRSCTLANPFVWTPKETKGAVPLECYDPKGVRSTVQCVTKCMCVVSLDLPTGQN